MYDILVIGGGLLGTGIARDAALRGLSVALFEKEDFGAGATSRLSRLASGSVSALHTLDFTRVREDLREREILLQIAPHLAQPLTCLVPFYSQGLLAQARLRAALALADALGLDMSLPLHQILSPAETLARAPDLRAGGLTGAALVWEVWIPRIERLALEMALDARDHGAVLRTHTRVTGLHWERTPRGRERVESVFWTDCVTGETGETRSALVVNAAGAWRAGVDVRLPQHHPHRERIVKSVSVITALLNGQRDALVFPHEDESRTLFALPGDGGTWIGGLEREFLGETDGALATGEETAALLQAIREFLPAAGPPRVALAAISPSIPAASLYAPPHPYEILDPATEGGLQEGLLTVSGGSLTSFRSIAEEVVDLACRKLGRSLATPSCRTASTPLPGAHGKYLCPEVCPPDVEGLRAEVERAVHEEECRTLCDFLMRRTTLFWTEDQGQAHLPVVLETMANLCGWNGERQEREQKTYEAALALTQAFRVM